MARWKSIAAVCAFLVGACCALQTTSALAATAITEEARNNGERLASRAENAANQLKTYLDDASRDGRRPDFTQPQPADLLGRALDVAALDALPAVRGDDLPWLMDWAVAANAVNKAIMFFGIASPVSPTRDAEAIGRNLVAFEDQQATIESFLLRITAREAKAAVLFMDGLSPAQRTPIRIEGFTKMRAAHAQMLISFLCVAEQMKPGNSRIVSAAVRDTRKEWAAAVLPGDRPGVFAMLDQVRNVNKDEPTRENLAAFRDLLANVKE